jgi:hypothetical protein
MRSRRAPARPLVARYSDVGRRKCSAGVRNDVLTVVGRFTLSNHSKEGNGHVGSPYPMPKNVSLDP